MTRPTIQLHAYVPCSSNTSLQDFAAAISTEQNHFYGVYIIRSDSPSERFRFGASGVSHSNRGEAGLGKRLKKHAGSTPTPEKVAKRRAAGKPPYNQTELRCPWSPLWACALSGANGPMTLIAEGLLGLCLVENGYEMCTQIGERSMLVENKKAAPLDVIIGRFYLYLTECLAVLGYNASVPGGSTRPPGAEAPHSGGGTASRDLRC